MVRIEEKWNASIMISGSLKWSIRSTFVMHSHIGVHSFSMLSELALVPEVVVKIHKTLTIVYAFRGKKGSVRLKHVTLQIVADCCRSISELLSRNAEKFLDMLMNIL